MSVGAPTIVRAEVPPAAAAVPEADSGRRGIPYLPGIEGLRGVALIGVLVFHGGFTWATGGFLGVSTFFTLSGFLITLLLVWEFSTTSRIDLKQFWMRRYRRLMPASLACLAGVCLFGATVATPGQLATLRGDVLAALAYVANWRFIVTGQSYANLFSSPSPVLHFWSLAIEEQFYLVFPVVVAATLWLTKGSRRILGAVLVVLSGLSLLSMFVLYTPGTDPSRVYYGTTTRAFELLVGALLALVLSQPAGVVMRIPRWAWVIAGSFAAIVTLGLWHSATESSPWLYQGGLAGYALMSALVIVAAIRRGPIRSVLGSRPLREIGAVSYGAYLYHWPIFLWLTPTRTHLSIWPLFALRCAVTFALAIVSARLLERPIRLRLRPTRIRPALLSGIAIATVVVAVVIVTVSPPKPAISFAAPVNPDFADVPAEPVVATVPSTPTDPALLPPPVVLMEGEKMRVLVSGDSAALTMGDGLQKFAAKGNDMTVADAGKLGCSVGRGGLIRYLGESRATYDYCDWDAELNQELPTIRPHVIVALWGTWDIVDRQMPNDPTWRAIGDPTYDAFLRAEMTKYLDLATSHGATVVWLTHPHIEAGTGGAKPGPFPENDPERIDRLNQMIREVAAGHPRVTVLDLAAHMASMPGGEINLTDRPDGIHWTAASSLALAPWIADSVDAIVHHTPMPALDAVTESAEQLDDRQLDDRADLDDEADVVDGRGGRRFAIAVGAITAAGLALRIAYIWFVRRGLTYGGDPYYYHAGANLLADGKGFISPYALALGQHLQTADHPPLYVAYLGFFSLLGIRSITGHLLVTGLLGAATIPIAALAGRQIAGRATGVIAALLVAFYPNIWRYDGMLLSETLVIFLVTVAIWLAYRYVRGPSWPRLVALGVVVGLCALARSELLLLAPFLIIPVVLGTRTKPWVTRWKWLAVAALSCLAAVTPWLAFNLARFDHPVLFTDNLGGTLVVANCDSAYYGPNTGYWDYNCGTAVLDRNGISAYEPGGRTDRVFRHDALAYLGDHTSRLPVVVAARLGRITGLFRPAQQMHLDIYLENTTDWVAQAGTLSFYAVAALAIAGGVIARRRRVALSPLLAPILVALLATALFYAATRFRASAEPSLCLLAAVALAAAWDRWSPRARGSSELEPSATDSVAASPEGPASPAPAASAS